MSDGKKDRILGLLKKNPKGLTVNQISYQLHISPVTAIIYLRELIGAKLVVERAVGRNKLYYYHKHWE